MMKKQYYDFEPGGAALKRMVLMVLVRIVGFFKIRNDNIFFTDGIGYIDQQITTDGAFEKGLLDHITYQSKKHGKTKIYIDIGANIGNHAVNVGQNFEIVVAYEPHPVLFRVLQANLLSNGISISETFNFGLGSKKEQATLLQSTKNHGLSKVYENSTMSSDFFGYADSDFDKSFKIDLRNSIEELSKYADYLNEAFIKIDVEGMEAEILSSLLPLLKKYRPIIAVEWAPSEQPELEKTIKKLDNYEIMGCFIRQSDNSFSRFTMNLLRGRRYELEKINFARKQALYPLVFLIPKIT